MNKKGITLIEVLIASLILVLIVSGVLVTMRYQTNIIYTNRHYNDALLIIQNEFEHINSLEEGKILEYLIDPGNEGDNDSSIMLQGATFDTEPGVSGADPVMVYTVLFSGFNTPVNYNGAQVREVTITISWNYNGKPYSFNMATRTKYL